MYKNLSDDYTKEYYRQIIDETLLLIEPQKTYGYYEYLYNQLLDIKQNVVIERKYKGWDSEDIEDEIYETYDIGAFAVKNLDEESVSIWI